MAFTNLIDWLRYPESATAPRYHRQLLLYPMETDVYESVNCLLQALPETIRIALLGCAVAKDTYPTVTQSDLRHYKNLLGQEFDIGIYNAYEGFHPNALLALAGTLRRAGRLIILCPPLAQWPTHSSVTRPRFLSYGCTLSKSYFIEQFIQQVMGEPSVAVFEAGRLRLPVLPVDEHSVAGPDNPIFATRDQENIYTSILADIGNNLPLCVLTAPRGRGKSALAGLICGALIHKAMKLRLISPLHQSQTVFYRHLAQSLATTEEKAKCLVPWLPPDHPDITADIADILIVDEAAALPLPVVLRIVNSNARCLLTTTTLGFEGSGLGFLHKFLAPRLHHGSLAHFELHEPVRWASDDPVEKLLDRCLLFIPSQIPMQLSSENILFERVRAEQLTFEKLAEVFHLLHESHYQTSPDDLMRLTDAPDIIFILAKSDGHLIGAAVINIEGGACLTGLAQAIASGQRRIQGHLSAQSIALVCAQPEFANQVYWRINRIAVHPSFRRQRIGKKMVRYIADLAESHNVDWLSCSYGSTHSVDRFWEDCGFTIARKGNKQDKASGQVSNLIVQPLSNTAHNKLSLIYGLHLFDKADSDDELCQSVNDFGLHTVIANRLNAYLKGSRNRYQTGNALRYAFLKREQASKAPLPVMVAMYIERVTEHKIIEKFKLAGKKGLERKIRLEAEQLLADR
ncbi:GNAT family N-acetyltransferase [Salinimonas chungwhensis]|uniref:GNAT family N-acetyltransferase n=1 Tax=Salinimonas chungwhensis TaxID=265425 RepID=UPI0003734041|nr:GNAT family N-acetyltransferase [Salinimonas chungwhensis]